MNANGTFYQPNMIPPQAARGSSASDASFYGVSPMIPKASNPNTPSRGSPVPSHSSYSSSPLNAARSGPGTRPVSPSALKTDPNDAFGGLVNFGNSSKPSLASMSLEQQRKMAQAQPLSQTLAQKPLGAWAPPSQTPPRTLSPNSFAMRPQGVLPLGTNIPVSSGQLGGTQFGGSANRNPFDDLLGSNKQQPSSIPIAGTQSSNDIWDLDYLAKEKPKPSVPAMPTPPIPQPSTSEPDPFDFSIFESKPQPPPQPQPPSQSPQPKVESLPASSFNRETKLQTPQEPPVSARQTFKSSPTRYMDSSDDDYSDREPQRHGSRRGTMDDLIAQIQDMGFDKQSAAIALEASNNNVDMAIDLLIRNREATNPPSNRRPSASSLGPMSARGDPNGPMQSQVANTASIIGKSVFSNAKSVFEFSKKKLSEAYSKASEKLAEHVENYNSNPSDSRGPSASSSFPPQRGGGNDAGFWKDRWEDDNDSDKEKTYQKYETDSSSDEENLRRPARKTPQFVDPVAHHSGWDAKEPEIQFTSQAQSGFPQMQWDSSSEPAKVSTQPPKPQPVSLASPEQLRIAEGYREKGNEKFKNGQFAEAEALYSEALSQLSEGDWGRIPILNNRAAARLKIGEHNGVISDCNEVQALNQDDLKSLLRRATAYEAKEKWDLAKNDYEVILAKDSSVKGVSQGLARVKKALSADKGESVKIESGAPFQSVAKKQPPPPKKPVNPLADFQSLEVPSGKMVEELREKNDKLEREEALKFSLKDSVDDKINAWKNGKDNNIRALLSSLDTILWKESNWVSINLSELITPQQVKIKYMKAIAKVHPDKLKPETTVEQRMIANNVFSVLNKAWDSFKQANGL
ncbi:hypothetical protein HDU67_004444 [Dinochytrium kinnereticum]|nr:hypothetical protein HDU67_004444 [Dinochytrium kinnereticum]